MYSESIKQKFTQKNRNLSNLPDIFPSEKSKKLRSLPGPTWTAAGRQIAGHKNASYNRQFTPEYMTDNAFRKVHSVSSNLAPLALPTAHVIATAASTLGITHLLDPRKFGNVSITTTPCFRLGSLAINSSQLRRGQGLFQVGQMLAVSFDALQTCPQCDMSISSFRCFDANIGKNKNAIEVTKIYSVQAFIWLTRKQNKN